MKVAAGYDRTHNPSVESCWVSRSRENFTSGSYGEGLETGRYLVSVPRQSFTRQTAFQDLTVHLPCEINTLGYPPAALLGFCVALIAYITFAILKAALQHVHRAKKIQEEFPGYYLADELGAVYRVILIDVPAQEWFIFRDMPSAQFVDLMIDLALCQSSMIRL